MSIDNSVVSLERIDHGVLPSNDLGRAFAFGRLSWARGLIFTPT
jgi:hypothetical protein